MLWGWAGIALGPVNYLFPGPTYGRCHGALHTLLEQRCHARLAGTQATLPHLGGTLARGQELPTTPSPLSLQPLTPFWPAGRLRYPVAMPVPAHYPLYVCFLLSRQNTALFDKSMHHMTEWQHKMWVYIKAIIHLCLHLSPQ